MATLNSLFLCFSLSFVSLIVVLGMGGSNTALTAQLELEPVMGGSGGIVVQMDRMSVKAIG